MYFVYTTLACALWLMLLINVKPFKMSVYSYQQIDSELVFIVFVSLFHVCILGINTIMYFKYGTTCLHPSSICNCTILPFATMIIYVLFLVVVHLCSIGCTLRENGIENYSDVWYLIGTNVLENIYDDSNI